jgi:hypothetical protein
MFDRWLENGWRLLSGLISRNVPTNQFSPRAIRNRCEFRPLCVPRTAPLERSEHYFVRG